MDVALKRIRSVTAGLTTQSKLDVQIIRVKSASAEFVTTSQLEVLIRGGARGLIEYNASLAAGETIEIDTGKMTITKGGANARPNSVIPEWPRLQPGKNVLVYTDPETGRSIEIEIVKEDRTI